MQVTTRQLPHHRVVRSNTHVNHRNSTSPIEVYLDILSTAFTLSFSNKSTTIFPKTYTNLSIYLQLSMVVSTVVWDVCQTVVCAHVASIYRTAEAVKGTSQATVSTTPTCARYDLCLVVVFLTSLAQLTKQLSDTDYCLFVSGVHPQTKKTSLHARHRQHRQRSSVTYKSRRHILPSLSTSKRRSNRQNHLRARGESRVHLLP